MWYVANVQGRFGFPGYEICLLAQRDDRVFHCFVEPELDGFVARTIHGAVSERRISSFRQLKDLVTEFVGADASFFQVKDKKQVRLVEALIPEGALVFSWEGAVLTSLMRCDVHSSPRRSRDRCALERCFALKLWLSSFYVGHAVFDRTITSVTSTVTTTAIPFFFG